MKRIDTLTVNSRRSPLKGLGEQLLNHSINLARDLRDEKIRLETVAKMVSALQLSRAKRFREIDAYTFNPRADVIFFELELSKRDS